MRLLAKNVLVLCAAMGISSAYGTDESAILPFEQVPVIEVAPAESPEVAARKELGRQVVGCMRNVCQRSLDILNFVNKAVEEDTFMLVPSDIYPEDDLYYFNPVNKGAYSSECNELMDQYFTLIPQEFERRAKGQQESKDSVQNFVVEPHVVSEQSTEGDKAQ